MDLAQESTLMRKRVAAEARRIEYAAFSVLELIGPSSGEVWDVAAASSELSMIVGSAHRALQEINRFMERRAKEESEVQP